MTLVICLHGWRLPGYSRAAKTTFVTFGFLTVGAGRAVIADDLKRLQGRLVMLRGKIS